MRSLLPILFSLILVTFATNSISMAKNESSVKDGVTSVLTKQAEAWNKGDIDSFLEGYVKSADTSYVSSDAEVWGFDALKARYVNKYGASKETMGQLKFSDLKIQVLSDQVALCIGHWHLDRKDKPAVGGVFSLVLKQHQGAWKIAHDHTSTFTTP